MKLPLLLLGLPLAALPLVQKSPNATAREEIDAIYGRWEKARTGFDRAVMEELLAPDFSVQIGPQTMTREEFIAEVSVKQPGAELTRFDSDILTLQKDPKDKDGWVAVITEKLEFQVKGQDGKPVNVCSFWVTRDRFKKTDGRWWILGSEGIGWENWSGGEKPPFADWDA